LRRLALLPSPRHARAVCRTFTFPRHVRFDVAGLIGLGWPGLYRARSSAAVGRDALAGCPACPTGSGVRLFRFSVKPSDLPTQSSWRLCRPWASALAGPGRLAGHCFFAVARNSGQSDPRTASREVFVPFSVCRSCCAIRGDQPSDHPASTFDSFARRRRSWSSALKFASLRFFRLALTVRGAHATFV
jgi:hypothetical protein